MYTYWHTLSLHDALPISTRLRFRCIHPAFRSERIIGRMSLRALLMRVFLIVALLANGPGIAGAAMHMDHLRDSAGDVTSVAAAQTRSEAMAACHGTATPPVADDHSHPRPAELVDAKSPLGACCQAGTCCACMHHVLIRKASCRARGCRSV